jgi:hypothetical protein
MLFQQFVSDQPFKLWSFKDQENKHLLWLTLVVMIISFGWLKYLYPYPNFIPPDSYRYLDAAKNNDFINIWPIGYSKFLRLLSIFTRSHLALVILQYLLLIASVSYFLFTIRYLLSPGKWLFRITYVLSIGNPLLPHIANFVSSDCLFVILSLIWFAQLCWLLYKPTLNLILMHAAVLLLAFMVRYTAVWYPAFSIGIIIFSHIPRSIKWLGIGSISFLILAFIGCTQYEYKKRTNTIQFTAFGGWQIAANALYGYAYSPPIDPERAPYKFRELHTLVNQHMDSLRRLSKRPDQNIGVYYQWDYKSPLRVYNKQKYKNDNKTPFFTQWASMSPLYASYGRWLITKYPRPFIKYYAWPNLKRYYIPPSFFMGSYNLGKKKVDSVAVSWFGWQNDQLPTRTKDKTIYIMEVISKLLAIINPFFLLCSIIFIWSAGLKHCNKTSKQLLICTLLIWFSNTLFSVLSAPIELRYQIFPIVITIAFEALLISWVIKSYQTDSNKKGSQIIPITESGL